MPRSEANKSDLYFSWLYSYTQELPARFKKDIAKAAVVHDDLVGLSGVERVLNNIGLTERLTKNDLELIFQEVGNNGEMPAKRFISIIWATATPCASHSFARSTEYQPTRIRHQE